MCARAPIPLKKIPVTSNNRLRETWGENRKSIFHFLFLSIIFRFCSALGAHGGDCTVN